MIPFLITLTDFDYTIEEIGRLYYQGIHLIDFRLGAEKIRIDSKWTNRIPKVKWTW